MLFLHLNKGIKKMSKSNKERQAESDNRKRAKGWKQKKVWATDAEFKVIDATLAELRKSS